ncbi:hypothetical protein [Corynebacterium diphtheriae]|uniref:hypothetical protein n=1 Tax=Corynebacterium diphtheriae TaxID=1717 RepID=UPI000AAA20B5|nr:hypothetical protein [Corynebacterium diphtheriae]
MAQRLHAIDIRVHSLSSPLVDATLRNQWADWAIPFWGKQPHRGINSCDHRKAIVPFLRELEFKTAKTQGQHSHGITAFLRFS